jgi:hypothetical protein
MNDDRVEFKRGSTKKKWFNNQTKEWVETSVWRIPYSKDTHKWLEENYGHPVRDIAESSGWSVIFDKIVMEEKVYLMYSLKFGIM